MRPTGKSSKVLNKCCISKQFIQEVDSKQHSDFSLKRMVKQLILNPSTHRIQKPIALVEGPGNHLEFGAQSRVVEVEDSQRLNQWINHRINVFNRLITTCSTGDLAIDLFFKETYVPFEPARLIWYKDWIVISGGLCGCWIMALTSSPESKALIVSYWYRLRETADVFYVLFHAACVTTSVHKLRCNSPTDAEATGSITLHYI